MDPTLLQKASGTGRIWGPRIAHSETFWPHRSYQTDDVDRRVGRQDPSLPYHSTISVVPESDASSSTYLHNSTSVRKLGHSRQTINSGLLCIQITFHILYWFSSYSSPWMKKFEVDKFSSGGPINRTTCFAIYEIGGGVADVCRTLPLNSSRKQIELRRTSKSRLVNEGQYRGKTRIF
jgi:hypothetical protein